MKKLLAILVVFTLVVGAVSAVDLGGTVFGHVNLIEFDTAEGSDVTASGGMDRARIDGSGSAGDTFGGYIRFQGFSNVESGNAVLAWWKPIDQFKLTIGGNGDGFWGKEGVTGWMFNQMPYDSGIAIGSGNIWGWGETVNSSLQTRFAFYGGFGDFGALLEITPIDILSINIAIPFISKAGSEAKDVFKATVGQVSLNLDFGNIAITYNGGGPFDSGVVHAYFGGNFGDLGLDVGLAYHFDTWGSGNGAMFAGVGLKFAAGSFGIKFRTALQIPAFDGQNFSLLVDLLPYIAITDNLCAFLNAGLGMAMNDTTDVGWFINPYLRVGAEWGPTFYFGIQIASSGYGDSSSVTIKVPVSLMVSF